MNRYTAAWTVLAGAAVGLEAATLSRGRGKADTFSAQVWRVLDWGDAHHPYLTTAARAGILGACGWAGLHLAYRLK